MLESGSQDEEEQWLLALWVLQGELKFQGHRSLHLVHFAHGQGQEDAVRG